MDKVGYIYGTKEAYLALDSHDPSAIYFRTDTRELYKGDQRYGDGVRVVADYASLPTFKTAASGVLYVCKDNSPTGDEGFSSSCGSETCSKVICHGDEHCMEIEVDETYDLGKRTYADPYKACFTTTSRKVYHSIVHNEKMPTIAAGAHYYLRGKYRFYPM